MQCSLYRVGSWGYFSRGWLEGRCNLLGIKAFAGIVLDMMPAVAHREIVAAGIAVAHFRDSWAVLCFYQRRILVNDIHADTFDKVLVAERKVDIPPGWLCCVSDDP